MKKNCLLPVFLVLLAIALVSGCSREYSTSGTPATTVDSFNLTINFTPVVDSSRLRFGTSYANYWKEKYTVSAFKFYVSKFDLINSAANRTLHINADKYFLVDASDSTTWSIKLLAIPFTYNRISFLIGVDSIRNVSGAQTGALDPANGMFWTWNSGYIMAKLEGNSAVSSQVNNKMEYHIGGFAGENNVLKKPELLFPSGQYLQINSGRKSTININADVNEWFYSPLQIKIATTASCTTPGLMAKEIAENYSGMFTVTAIINN